MKEKYGKPGDVFLGVVHRLDKPVSGVLLFARTSKAAARLSEQFRNSAVEKAYWAVVEPDANLAPAGTLVDWLAKDESKRIVECVPAETPGAQHSVTHFQMHSLHDGLTLLELRPQTGRKHQLRATVVARFRSTATRSTARRTFSHAIALHARSLTFLHPTKHEPIT